MDRVNNYIQGSEILKRQVSVWEKDISPTRNPTGKVLLASYLFMPNNKWHLLLQMVALQIVISSTAILISYTWKCYLGCTHDNHITHFSLIIQVTSIQFRVQTLWALSNSQWADRDVSEVPWHSQEGSISKDRDHREKKVFENCFM